MENLDAIVPTEIISPATTDGQPQPVRRKTKTHAPKNRIAVEMRRQKLVKGIIAGKRLDTIAKELDINPCHARQMATQANVKSDIVRILDAKGLSLDKLSDKLTSLLSAESSHFFSTKDGDIVERKSQALETQRKSMELAFRLHGALKPDGQAGDTIVNNSVMMMVISQMQSKAK